MITRTYIASEKRALEIAAWARIVGGALKREANRAFLAGEIERATSFLLLIAYTERLAETELDRAGVSADGYRIACVEVFPASSSLGARDGETCGEDVMNGAEADVLVAVTLGIFW